MNVGFTQAQSKKKKKPKSFMDEKLLGAINL
jgi:hypothetical protein